MVRNHALRKVRIQRHWTQSTLAAQLNTTRMTVVRWEQGTTSPSLYFREQLCKLFGMSAQDLGLDHQPLENKPSGTWLVPWERNLFFTGRETTLLNLHNAFWEDKEATPYHVQILSGLAGIGKTQVALEYAYRFRKHYSVVVWLRAETSEILLADLTKLATALRLPMMHERDEAQMIQTLRTWLETATNWLLILDNVEELALAYNLLFPSGPKGSVLITTRIQATGRLGCQFTLAEMDVDEGTLLLLHRAKLLPIQLDLTKAPVDLYAEAMKLCQELGGFPLALEQAGSYIEETGCNLSGYLARFRQRCSALLAWRGRNPGGYPFSVTATILLARERVERQSPIALDILCMCLFLHPSGIPEQLITRGAQHLGTLIQDAVADLLSLDHAFALLNGSSLLRRDPETHLLMMHRLVQAVLRDQLAERMQCLWVERVLQALQSLFPANSYHEMVVWPLCDLLLPHILSCIEYIEQLSWDERQEHMSRLASALLLKAAEYLLERARYQEAETFLKRMLDISMPANESAQGGGATALHTLALLYERLGRYSEAEVLVRRVLVILRWKLTENDPGIASALNTLAQLYGRQGKYAEAEHLACQALQCYQPTDEDCPGAAEVLNTLAQLAIWTGKYQMAIAWAMRALHILEKKLGIEHPSVAAVVHTLAIASWEQGEYTLTGELFQRTFAIWEQALGPEHPERAEPLKNLGEIYLLQQRYDEAQYAVRCALDIYQQSLSQEHPQMAVPFSILGAIATEQGSYKCAEEFYQHAYQLCCRFLDRKHPHMALVLHGQARLALKQNRYTQARTLLRRALTIRMHKLGKLHPDTLLTRELYQSVLKECQHGDRNPDKVFAD